MQTKFLTVGFIVIVFVLFTASLLYVIPVNAQCDEKNPCTPEPPPARPPLQFSQGTPFAPATNTNTPTTQPRGAPTQSASTSTPIPTNQPSVGQPQSQPTSGVVPTESRPTDQLGAVLYDLRHCSCPFFAIILFGLTMSGVLWRNLTGWWLGLF